MKLSVTIATQKCSRALFSGQVLIACRSGSLMMVEERCWQLVQLLPLRAVSTM
jgi:hypothetical protein